MKPGVDYDRANATYRADIFACMTGYDEKKLPTRIDITGAFDGALVKDIDTAQAYDEYGNPTPRGRALHYSSALYYRMLWKWQAMVPPNQIEYFVNPSRVENTTCFWVSVARLALRACRAR